MTNSTSYVQKLRTLPLFQSLSEKEFELLQHHLKPFEAPQGQWLFKEGDPGMGCFIIVSGSVGVFKQLPGQTGTGPSGSSPVATLNEGAIVGHMALIDNKQRSASCRVESDDTLLLKLDRVEFDMLFNAQTPFAFKILDRVAIDLVSSLRKTTALLQKAHREQQRSSQVEVVLEATGQYPGVR